MSSVSYLYRVEELWSQFSRICTDSSCELIASPALASASASARSTWRRTQLRGGAASQAAPPSAKHVCACARYSIVNWRWVVYSYLSSACLVVVVVQNSASLFVSGKKSGVLLRVGRQQKTTHNILSDGVSSEWWGPTYILALASRRLSRREARTFLRTISAPS